jgi:REP element-mobilizing transposase RayT
MTILHKGAQHRIRIPDAAYFITVKIQGNHPFFREPIFCELFVENLRLCKRLKGFELYGWFLGYDHFHLLMRLGEKFDLSNIMHFLKRNISRNTNYLMGYHPNDEHHPTTEGADDYPRLQMMEMIKFVVKKCVLAFRLKIKYFNNHPFPKFKWQKSFRDHDCRGEADFRFHLGYIIRNPAKHHLPDDWPYIYTNSKYADLADDCGLN